MRLGAPNYLDSVKFRNGSNGDIISVLHDALPAATKEVTASAKQFQGKNNLATARNIWEYLRNHLTYKKDPEGYQFIKLPRRLTTVKNGDCKSYSLLAASILSALKMPVIFRYGAYNNDSTPSHVYVVTQDESGREVIIDGVYNHFNKEVPYFKKYDYPMNIQVLSGLNKIRRARKPITLETLRNNQPAGSFRFTLVNNRILARDKKKQPVNYNPKQLQSYSNALRARIKNPQVAPIIKRLAADELTDIQRGAFYGVIPFVTDNAAINGIQQEIGLSFKKLGKGIKKAAKKVSLKNISRGLKAIALLPTRKAFLALVALNVRGLAARLSKANPNKVAEMWVKFGGKGSVLTSAINKGKTRKAILGGGRIKAIKGIGYVHYQEEDAIGEIGALPAVAAALAAATPIVIAALKLLKGENVPETEGATTEQIEAEAMGAGGGDVVESIKTFGQNAYDIVASTGIIPERNTTPQEQQVNDAIPGDDFTEDPAEKKSNLLPIALAVGAGLLLMKGGRK